MPIPAGTYELGPEQANLTVKTGKTGAAAKAGHNLEFEVTSWSATLQVGDDQAGSSVALSADSRSLRVVKGTGGMQALGDDDKVAIKQTIDDEVLKGGGIEFRSRAVEAGPDGDSLRVTGELRLLGTGRPLTFDLQGAADGHLTAAAIVKQTDWGIKPYSTLFGTLKVVDEVQVRLDGRLPAG